MQTAHELATWAAKIAAGIPLELIESFSIEQAIDRHDQRVTIRLTTGEVRRYRVYEEKEGDTPAGESHPDSPSR